MDFRAKHERAFVLLSGGIDSTTVLYWMLLKHSKGVAVSIDYGQRHHKEIEAAKAVVSKINNSHPVYRYEHVTLSLSDLLSGHRVMLTNPDAPIPNLSYDEIKGISPTYVPFRNGTMLSVITALAMKYVLSVQQTEGLDPNDPQLKDLVEIGFGAHAEDARGWAYPDCTPEFIGAMANAIYVGSYQSVRLATPFSHMTKADIIHDGMDLGVPYDLTWSCYAGGEKHCGVCPTCRARKQAFDEAGCTDPTDYAE